MDNRPLTIVIDARLRSGVAGGIEQVIIGLVSGLSRFAEDRERYILLAYPGSTDWLAPYVGGPCRLHMATGVHPQPPQVPPNPLCLAHSDGTIESLGAQVVHFPIQRAFITRVPSIYHPHDLQHLHLPKFFSEYEQQKRELTYPAYCRQAAVVAVSSSWVKDDVVRHYDLPPEKVHVVPWAPIVGEYKAPAPADLEAVRSKYSIPDQFIFYPAQTWPHKNHLALLDAIARLRDQNHLIVHLVSCGKTTEHFSAIEERIARLGLRAQVQFLGFVSAEDLRSIQHLCRAVIIPTLFEAASVPLNDAFLAGAPAACSNVTSLPQQAGDAALVFDPYDVTSIASAIARLWTDAPLRQRLAAKGRERVAQFTWERTARHFRALYRMIAQRQLTDEDRAMLSQPPLL